MGFWHRSQEFLASRARKDKEHEFVDKIAAAGIGCLPFGPRRSTREAEENPVCTLSHDLEQLRDQFPECNSESGYDAEHECLRKELSVDVQTQLHKIFLLIKALTGEDGHLKGHKKQAVLHEAESELLEMLAGDIPVQLLSKLPVLEFEARKDVMNMCCALLCSQMPQSIEQQVLDYFVHHQSVFSILVKGYEHEDVAMHYGVVLRSIVRHPSLHAAFLKSGKFFELMQYPLHDNWDVASDAFDTLQWTLLQSKEVSAKWLEQNAKEFFTQCDRLLQTDNYLVNRQALSLLREMFFHQAFRKVTLAYVSDDKNLQMTMNLLLSSSTSIQVDAFHLFKIFVVYPDKTSRVQRILFKNKDKLVQHLEALKPNKPEPKFLEDQQKIIKKLRQLQPAPAVVRRDNSSGSDSATSA